MSQFVTKRRGEGKQKNLELFTALWNSDDEEETSGSSSETEGDFNSNDVKHEENCNFVENDEDSEYTDIDDENEKQNQPHKDSIITTEDMKFCTKLAEMYRAREYQEVGAMNHTDIDKCECKYCWIWKMHELLELDFPEVVVNDESDNDNDSVKNDHCGIENKNKIPKIIPRSEFFYPFEDEIFDDRDSLDRFMINIRDTVKSMVHWIFNLAKYFWPCSNNSAKISPEIFY